MLNSGKCTKCGSGAVARKRGSPILNSNSRVSVNITSLDIWITKCICTDCGFIEEWIENKSDLQKFKGKEKT